MLIILPADVTSTSVCQELACLAGIPTREESDESWVVMKVDERCMLVVYGPAPDLVMKDVREFHVPADLLRELHDLASERKRLPPRRAPSRRRANDGRAHLKAI